MGENLGDSVPGEQAYGGGQGGGLHVPRSGVCGGKGEAAEPGGGGRKEESFLLWGSLSD